MGIVTPKGGIFSVALLSFLIAAFFFMGGTALAQTTIAADGFNGSTSLFTRSGGAFFTGNSAGGDRPANSPLTTEGTGSVGVTNGTLILTTTNNINTTNFANILLTFRLAAFSVGSTSDGVDLSDNVVVEISANGGGIYSTILTVNGAPAETGANNDVSWAYSATGIATAAYPATAVFVPGNGGGTRTTDGYSTLSITSLPATSTLRVRITLKNNAGTERWVMDDFKITGCSLPAAPTVTTPVNYCQNETAVPLTAGGSNLLWYTTPGGPGGTSTAPTPATSTPGTISNYVSQTIGCEGPRAQIDVIVKATPVASVTNQTNITCFSASDGTITVSAGSGTGPYTFSVDNGANYLPATGSDLRLFTGLAPNTPYRIKVKDDNGCVSK